MARWYDNADTRGYNNMLGTQAWPEYNENLFRNTGIGRFDMRNMMRPDNLTQDLGASNYQAPPPPELNTLDPNWQNELAGYGSTMDRGNIENKSRFSGLIGKGLNYLKDQFQYRGAEGPAWNPQTGEMLSIEDQDKMNALGGYYSEPARYSRRQDKRVNDMLARQAAGKNFSLKNLQRLQSLGYGRQEVVPQTVTNVTRPGGGGGYTGPVTQNFNPQQFARAGRRADRPGGFSDPGKGSYGPHMAEGGRIGYQGGELVEDDYMAEATPQGMMEENIEEVQGEPSREQLEAIALEIFRLPLEQLNEQQLEVVYQAAMEQEPSEEEVQFAAQEGPGEGIASLV